MYGCALVLHQHESLQSQFAASCPTLLVLMCLSSRGENKFFTNAAAGGIETGISGIHRSKMTRTVRLWAACLSSFLPTVRELAIVKSGKTSELSVIKLFSERSYILENLICYV